MIFLSFFAKTPPSPALLVFILLLLLLSSPSLLSSLPSLFLFFIYRYFSYYYATTERVRPLELCPAIKIIIIGPYFSFLRLDKKKVWDEIEMYVHNWFGKMTAVCAMSMALPVDVWSALQIDNHHYHHHHHHHHHHPHSALSWQNRMSAKNHFW